METYDTESIDSTVSLIKDRISYVDTVQVLIQPPLYSPDRIREIEDINPGAFFYRTTRKCWPWTRFLILHQPSDEALALINQSSPEHLVTRCDVSLDLITDTREDAAAVQSFLTGHLIQRWRGKRKVVEVGEGDYWDFPRSWTARNFVV